ncbi:DUF4424 domain-containing protein [Neorhizobium lilium]|uniref:DUF4424 domain-containing protein n=1 Tax=Neorhizobium lilium TaxID=2503024 RepID=A0A444LAX5_9HYPH|nr:DUF4424 domain-containing protein [Neorhizobium lilium]RWX74741.1 DUF4424 domain-containing protein [Neorhizobium lilium]
MRMKHSHAWALRSFVLIVVSISTPLQANDTSAVLGVGGLSLTTSDDIVMQSEDLHLSPSEIRVHYVFRSESDRDITTTVAFPLPDIDQSAYAMVFLPVEDQENFVGFQVTIDGKSIHPKMEQKAVTDEGVDVTTVVTKAGLPVNSKLSGWEEKVRALPDNVWRDLVDQGLIEAQDPDDRSADFSVTWNLRATFHWEQTFPAGKTVTVDHRYKPMAGGVSIFAGETQFKDYASYCLDDQGKAGVHRLLKQAQAAAKADPERAEGISPIEVSYVLTTGANWKGPIEDFRLTIDKEMPHAVLSLCMSGLKKTGTTTFEIRRENFTPTEDIRFVVFHGQ